MVHGKNMRQHGVKYGTSIVMSYASDIVNLHDTFFITHIWDSTFYYAKYMHFSSQSLIFMRLKWYLDNLFVWRNFIHCLQYT